MRRGKVFVGGIYAGVIREDDDGYAFEYDQAYLSKEEALPVSLTLPLSSRPYLSKTMFPFFDGLIPEGWLLEVATRSWKLNPRDRMGLLLVCCHDPIGNVSVEDASDAI